MNLWFISLASSRGASIYNAMALEGCAKLVEFMKKFEEANG